MNLQTKLYNEFDKIEKIYQNKLELLYSKEKNNLDNFLDKLFKEFLSELTDRADILIFEERSNIYSISITLKDLNYIFLKEYTLAQESWVNGGELYKDAFNDIAHFIIGTSCERFDN